MVCGVVCSVEAGVATVVRNSYTVYRSYYYYDYIYVRAILPNSRTLDGNPLRQNWSTTLHTVYTVYIYRHMT